MSAENVLKVENITMQFGGVIAVDNMNLESTRAKSCPSSAPTEPVRPRLSM